MPHDSRRKREPGPRCSTSTGPAGGAEKYTLLTIPREIRNVIYDFALTPSKVKVTYDDFTSHVKALPPRLPQICQQIRKETKDICLHGRQDYYRHPCSLDNFWRDSSFQQSHEPDHAARWIGAMSWTIYLERPGSARFQRLLVSVTTFVGPGPPCWSYMYHLTIYGSKIRSAAKPLQSYASVLFKDVGQFHRSIDPFASAYHGFQLYHTALPLETCADMLKASMFWLRKHSSGSTSEAAKMTLLNAAQEFFEWKASERCTSTAIPEQQLPRAIQPSKPLRGLSVLAVLMDRAIEEQGKSAALARAQAHPKGVAGACRIHRPAIEHMINMRP